jgi:hypothetical protein
MKSFIHKSLLFALCSSAIIACKPTLDSQVVIPGNADFSKFISIGDGTAGGYADASLNRDAQLAAFPNLLAQQFKLVGGGEFIQPLVDIGKSYGYENNQPFTKYDLHYVKFCDGKTELYPQQLYKITPIDILNFKVSPVPTPTNPPPYYNNLAAQGTKIIYVNKKPTWNGSSDTYWKKISSTGVATNAGAATMLSDAIAQKPTFVSLNIGTVDIYRYAKSGGNQDNGTDDFITPIAQFHDSLYSIMNTLTAHAKNHVKGVINNIIGVESFPYITYIKYDGLILSASEAATLNAFHKNQFSFHEGRNPYVIYDASATNGKRQIKANEHVLIEIPQDSLRCYNLGGKLPIRGRWVLDASEINIIKTTVDQYNTLLKTAAEVYNFAYTDNFKAMEDVVKGTQFQGVKLTSEFVNGNQFSLDGLNISALGQVAQANSCIAAINEKYGSTLPMVDASKTKGVVFH